jgi:hypothetical protein
VVHQDLLEPLEQVDLLEHQEQVVHQDLLEPQEQVVRQDLLEHQEQVVHQDLLEHQEQVVRQDLLELQEQVEHLENLVVTLFGNMKLELLVFLVRLQVILDLTGPQFGRLLHFHLLGEISS